MRLLSLAVAFSLVLSGAAAAAPMTYFTDEDFNTDTESFAGPSGSEDFEDAGLDSTLFGVTRNFNGFTTTLVSTVNPQSDKKFNFVGNSLAMNGAGLSGLNLQVGLMNTETLTLTFDRAIRAFGATFAYINNAVLPNKDNGLLEPKLVERSRISIDGQDVEWFRPTIDSSVGFFGVISSTAFTTVTIRGLPDSEGFGLDDVRWIANSTPNPTPVPLPASGLLLMGAMVVAGLFGRRRVRA